MFYQVDQMEKNKERTKIELKSQYPLLSRIKPWLKQQLRKTDAEHAARHIWDAHIRAIGKNNLRITTQVQRMFRFPQNIALILKLLISPWPSLDTCKNRNLHQSAYFLSRDLSFRQDRETRLRQELKPATKVPVKTFHFKTKIWFPQNWVVEVSEPPSTSSSSVSQTNHEPPSILDEAVRSQIRTEAKVSITYHVL